MRERKRNGVEAKEEKKKKKKHTSAQTALVAYKNSLFLSSLV